MVLHPCSAEQQRCVDGVLAGNNVVVRAQAGAGKSTTFLHTAKAWLDRHPDGGKVIILCFNVNLRAASEVRVAELGLEDRVHCFTVHSLASQIHGVGIGDTLTLMKHLESAGTCPDDYDLCLIDESQDLSESMVAVINQLQALRNRTMRYMVVGDRRQAIYDFARESEPQVLIRPETVLLSNGAPWMTCELNESYRVTPPIAAFLNVHFRHPGSTPIVGVNVRGAQPQPEYVVGDAARGDLLRVVTEQLLTYRPDQIMVLAPSVRSRDYRCRHLAHALSERRITLHTTHRRLVEVNPDLLRNKLFISTFHQAKGDERPCVIVLGADARLHARRGFPMTDGVEDVDNALHVALTRASEKLVVFVAHDQQPYPSVDLAALPELAAVRELTPMVPDPAPPAPPELKSIRRNLPWLVEFCSEESIEALAGLITRDPQVRLGPPTLARPDPIATMHDGHVEEVAGYYPAAVVGAVHRAHVFARTRDPLAMSKLEEEVRTETRAVDVVEGLPPLYRRFVREVVAHGTAPDGPRGWLTLSVLHQALKAHRFRHVLRQITDFGWLDATAAAFFGRCVDNMRAVVRTHETPDFFVNASRTDELTKTKIEHEILYMTVLDDVYTPWVLSFDDVPSESNLLHAVGCMWLMRTRRAVVYCMSTNTLHSVRVHDSDALNAFAQRLIVAKRRIALDAAEENPALAELLATFAAPAGP